MESILGSAPLPVIPFEDDGIEDCAYVGFLRTISVDPLPLMLLILGSPAWENCKVERGKSIRPSLGGPAYKWDRACHEVVPDVKFSRVSTNLKEAVAMAKRQNTFSVDT